MRDPAVPPTDQDDPDQMPNLTTCRAPGLGVGGPPARRLDKAQTCPAAAAPTLGYSNSPN